MSVLIQRDVVPFWQTQDPPSQSIPPGRFQVAIGMEGGRRLGTTWVTTTPMASYTAVESTTQLDVGALSKMARLAGTLFLETQLTYGPSDTLDEFTFTLDSGAFSAEVSGARYDREYACTATFGRVTKTLTFDGRLSQFLGDSFRPFTYLKGLHVGQSWRLRLIDPLAMLQSRSLEFSTQLVRVTRRETIEHAGQRVNCFRIETDGAIAWADADGRVLRQQVRIPFLGTWVLEAEPFNDQAHRLAEKEIRRLHGKRHPARPKSQA